MVSGMKRYIILALDFNDTFTLIHEQENLIIPTSGDSNTLRDLLDKLMEVQESNPSYTLRLLGYPEWQTYSTLIDEYYRVGVYFFSLFRG